jgi:FlaA1/EpsC-like NDP-sugar epimerase
MKSYNSYLRDAVALGFSIWFSFVLRLELGSYYNQYATSMTVLIILFVPISFLAIAIGRKIHNDPRKPITVRIISIAVATLVSITLLYALTYLLEDAGIVLRPPSSIFGLTWLISTLLLSALRLPRPASEDT